MAALQLLFLTPTLSPQRLRILYSKILATVQSMPQDAAYRKYTEQLVSDRFDHVRAVSERLRGKRG